MTADKQVGIFQSEAAENENQTAQQDSQQGAGGEVKPCPKCGHTTLATNSEAEPVVVCQVCWASRPEYRFVSHPSGHTGGPVAWRVTELANGNQTVHHCQPPLSEDRFRVEPLCLSALQSAHPASGAEDVGAWVKAEDVPTWSDGIVTDGKHVAFAQKAEADYGGTYWATDEGDGCLEWEPTLFSLTPQDGAVAGDGGAG